MPTWGTARTVDFLSLSIFGFDRASYRRAHGKDDFDRVVARLDALHSLYCDPGAFRKST
jgi:hypothetical protein